MASGPDRDSDGPTIVGIGASAGGLDALKTFFAAVPDDSGLAFVVVVHLSPEHTSQLAEILQPVVGFPVEQVTATTHIRPDHVYVIPPNRNLSAIDTHLRLSPLEAERRERAPVEHFLRTLAAAHDGRSVAVILTGTGSDGALGIKEVKERGGLTIAQDPADAQYDGMPQSAISTGMVDLILPLVDIPDAIVRYGGMRRIRRRMQIRQIVSFAGYLDLLQNDVDEVRNLADDLLITVSSFFRDQEVLELRSTREELETPVRSSSR